MAEELEAKYKVADFAAVRAALRAAGAIYRGAVRQIDVFFDTPERALYHADRALRLRRLIVEDAVPGGVEGGWLLTTKGARGHSARAKIRQETQTAVADGEVMTEILQHLGFQVFTRLEKRRASHQLGNCLVELDEVSPLGCFVEIEAPCEEALEDTRRKIGLEDRPIVESYLKLIERECGRVPEVGG